MTEISVSHLYKSYGDNVVLHDLSLEVFSGEKVALVGGNGAGKTTLLRILSGSESFDSGTVSIATGRRVGVLSQLPEFPEAFTAGDVLRDAFAPILAMKLELEELESQMTTDHAPALLTRYGKLSHAYEVSGGFDLETPLARVRAGLQIDDALYERPFDKLSGGEQTRINMARLILSDADLLLLDEPTNHLDVKSVEWLEGYLSRYKGAVVAVSHDRYFLDNVARRVIELRDGKAESFTGNYSHYASVRRVRRETQKLAYERELRERKRLTDTARRMHDYAGKNAKLHKRAFAIEKRIARVGATERPETEWVLRGGFRSDCFGGADVLRIEKLSCGFQCPLFDSVSLSVRAGERIGILGDNGAGKTTLLRAIMGTHAPLSGVVRRGPSVKPAYLPQQVCFPHPQRTLLDTLLYEQNETTQNARDRLGRFHFIGDDVFARVENLSGGEKSRLMLCMLMKNKVNLLLLDEPTNHLDISSREWMEEAVEGFKETLLFVSHDRWFIARFATRLWVVERGGVTDFPGTFAEYSAYLADRSVPSAPVVEGKLLQPKNTPAPAEAKHGREQRVREARLRALQSEIEKREERLGDIEREMEDAATDAAALQTLFEEQAALTAEKDDLYEQWGAMI